VTALKRSQSLFSKIGSEGNLPELERRWGELFLRTGALDEALEHARHSIDLARRLDNPLEQAMSSRLLGQVFLARGAWESAEDALQQSLQILGDLDNAFEAARTKLALARLAQASGSFVTARAYLAQATETFEQLSAQAHLTEARELEQNL
jgi:tetratricopeptide (TPR) repeat protein